MEMIAKYGAGSKRGGTVTISEGTRGLFDIFRPIGSGDKYASFRCMCTHNLLTRKAEEDEKTL